VTCLHLLKPVLQVFVHKKMLSSFW